MNSVLAFNLKFHHIGVATSDIEKELTYYKMLGYKESSDFFCDNIQSIKGIFIEAEGQPTLELLENLTDKGPLTSCLEKGIKFYHFAYETNDIEKDVASLVASNKAIVIVPVTKATFFSKICFLMLKNMMMIELVQINKG